METIDRGGRSPNKLNRGVERGAAGGQVRGSADGWREEGDGGRE